MSFRRNRTLIKTIIDNGIKKVFSKVTIKGWVQTIHKNKQLFIKINDGSSLFDLQIVVDKEHEDKYSSIIDELTPYASIEVNGIIVKSESEEEIEIQLNRIKLLGKIDSTSKYIFSKKKNTLGYLRKVPHLRSKNKLMNILTSVRNKVTIATHNFFQDLDFKYINTPIIKSYNYEEDENKYLTCVSNLHLEDISHGVGDVYTISQIVGAESCMVESSIVFSTIDDVIDLAEDYLRSVIYNIISCCRDDLDFLEKNIEKNLLNKLLRTANQDIKKISYDEAINILISVKDQFTVNPKKGCDLNLEHENFLTKKFGTVIIYNYPKNIKSFYMKVNKDNKTVASMNLLVPNIGSIIQGSEREDNYEKLFNKIKESKLEEEKLSWYLDVRRYGTVPHGGFEMYFEKFIMFLTGVKI
jgi:asparaginyl-tRNA synthetase